MSCTAAASHRPTACRTPSLTLQRRTQANSILLTRRRKRTRPKPTSHRWLNQKIANVTFELNSCYRGFPVHANPQLDRLYPIAKDRQRQFRCADCLFLRSLKAICNKPGRFDGLGAPCRSRFQPLDECSVSFAVRTTAFLPHPWTTFQNFQENDCNNSQQPSLRSSSKRN